MSRQKNAFEKWIIQNANGNVLVAAQLLLSTMNDSGGQSPLVWDLLELTGDTSYDQETFIKAAELLLSDEITTETVESYE